MSFMVIVRGLNDRRSPATINLGPLLTNIFLNYLCLYAKEKYLFNPFMQINGLVSI